MANKNKRCKWCKKWVEAVSGVQVPAGFFCDMKHVISFVIARKIKQKDKDRKRTKKAHKAKKATFYANDRPTQLRLAQKAFNAFIRWRDKYEACISCGRHHQGQYHAGHYRSVGAAPHLRFNQFNNNKQCAPCNNHKSGNISEYRIRLVQKIGVSKVEELESLNEPLKLSLEDIRLIKVYYTKLLKRIKEEL